MSCNACWDGLPASSGTEPSQENENKKTKHQTSHSECADPIDSDLYNSDCEK